MDYETARPQIVSGDILAWSHRSWKSWYDFQVQMVRVFTQSEYCHVGVAWIVGGRAFVIEAVGSGVRIFPLSRLVPFYLIKRGEWSADIEESLLQEVGQPYSKLQAVLAFLKKLKPGVDREWQCAELITNKLKLPCGSTPSEVVEYLLTEENLALQSVS